MRKLNRVLRTDAMTARLGEAASYFAVSANSDSGVTIR